MTDPLIYSVVSTGELLADRSKEDVLLALSKLFSIDELLVSPLLEKKQRFVRNNLSKPVAEYYFKTLTSAGVEAVISIGNETVVSGSECADINELRGTEYSSVDLKDKKANKVSIFDTIEKLRKSKVLLKYGALMMSVAYILSNHMGVFESFGFNVLDLGYWSYVPGYIVFVFGSYKYCETKNVTSSIKHLSMLGFFGLSIILLIMNTEADASKKILTANRMTAIIIIVLTIIWVVEFISPENHVEDYLEKAAEIAVYRDNNRDIDSDSMSQEISKMRNQTHHLITAANQLIKGGELLDEEKIMVLEVMFNELTFFFDGLNYQQYVHKTSHGKKSLYLSDRAILRFKHDIYVKLINFKVDVNSEIFSYAFRNWMGGYVGNDKSIIYFRRMLSNAFLEALTKLHNYNEVQESSAIVGNIDNGEISVNDIKDFNNINIESFLTEFLVLPKNSSIKVKGKYIYLKILPGGTGLSEEKVAIFVLKGESERHAKNGININYRFVRVGGNLPNMYFSGKMNQMYAADRP